MSNLFSIILRSKGNDGWPVDVHVELQSDSVPSELESVLHFDTNDLTQYSGSPLEYGRVLGNALFQESIRDAFVRASADSEGRLYIRLQIEDDELRSLHWEWLCAPLPSGWALLALEQRFPTAFYLPSNSNYVFPPLDRADLEALVLVANPDGLAEYSLDEFADEQMMSIAQSALSPIPTTVLTTSLKTLPNPTIDNLAEYLTRTSYNILHIVCHGRMVKRTGETILFLTDEDGQVAQVTATDFIDRLQSLNHRPYFVFLASCETASEASTRTMDGLAQRLVQELGIPAVIAMTAQVSVETATILTQKFYERLYAHGEVDLALTEACAGLADHEDITVPALYTRYQGKPLFSQTTNDLLAPSPKLVATYLANLRKQWADHRQNQSEVEKIVYGHAFTVRPFRGGRSHPLEQTILDAYNIAETQKGKDAPAFLLLADPGVGKSEALFQLTSSLAKRALPYYQSLAAPDTDGYREIVPIYLDVSDFSTYHSFDALIQGCLNTHLSENIIRDTQINPFLKDYPCLICFDNLDDLLLQGDQDTLKQLRQFIQSYSTQSVGYLIACRTRIYRDQLGALNTFVLDLLPTETVKQIITDYVESGDNNAGDGAVNEILTHDAMLKVACNRSTLEIILKGQDPLSSRGMAYQRRVQPVLDKVGQDVNEREFLERILEAIAYDMHKNRKLSYSEREMMEIINAYLAEWQEQWGWRAILYVLKSTELLIQNKDRHWQFSDRLMQAYFTAAAIVHVPSRLETILHNAKDYWWQEPLEMLVGLHSDPDDLLFQMVDQDPESAAHCVRFVGRPIKNRTFDTIVDGLMNVMRGERATGRLKIIRLFRRMTESGYPPSKNALWVLISEERKSMVVTALARLLVALHNDQSVLSGRSVPPSDNAVCEITQEMRQVIDLWGDYRESNSEQIRLAIEQRLIAFVSFNGVEATRVQGMTAIALGHIGTNQALDILLRLLQDKRDPFLLWCVVEGLREIRDERIAKLAVRLYKRSKIKRTYALYLLGTSGVLGEPYYKAAYEILEDALQQDNLEVRGYAARAIALLRTHHRPFQRLLETYLQYRAYRVTDQWVRRRFIEALGYIGTPDVIPTLDLYLRCVQQRTRHRTREAIAEIKRRHELV
ncbi:MAG: CHAT domain-containing protein [Chloroflexota bacterium]